MSCLLHLSDTHFGTERPEVCEALLGLAHKLKPEVIVLSGDITQDATQAQFRAAAQFVQQLPRAALLALPGDHDLPTSPLTSRLLSPYRRYCQMFGNDLEPSLDLPGWQLTTVDSTRRWRQRHGTLSSTQTSRVARRLQQAHPGDWRIVVTHHPLVVNRPEDAVDRPWGHARALECWSAAGMDVVLGGHTHTPFVAAAPLVAANGHCSWLVQTGTAVSRRTRHGLPNSVTLLAQSDHTKQRQRLVARWDYSHHLGCFVESERRQLS